MKKFALKRLLIIIAIALLAITAFWASFQNNKKRENDDEKKIFEVAIMVRAQNNPNLAEDARTSLKEGDALVVQSEGHNWSETEKISYLILRMNLTKNQAEKLTRPKMRELKEKDLGAAEQTIITEEKERAKKEGREYIQRPSWETLVAREYYIDFDKIGFTDPASLLSGQPYSKVLFDWSIVKVK